MWLETLAGVRLQGPEVVGGVLFPDATDHMKFCCFSPDGRLFASTSSGLWDTAQTKRLQILKVSGLDVSGSQGSGLGSFRPCCVLCHFVPSLTWCL